MASASSGERLPAGTRDVKTVHLGDLIVAAFDEAARWSTSPAEASRFATQRVAFVWLGAQAEHSLSTVRVASRACRLVMG